MATLDVTGSGTYTVSNKLKVKVDTSSPINATLQGGGGAITKLKLDFNDMPAGSTFNVDFSTFAGGPMKIRIEGYNAVDQINFSGATLHGIDPTNPSKMTFSYVGADGNTYTGVFQLRDTGNKNWATNPMAVCFAKGTRIATPDGEVAVEDLCPGDRVLTWTGKVCRVRWAGLRHLSQFELAANPALLPVRVFAGALGGGQPDRDLTVSPQHRVLLSGPAMELQFATSHALVPAVSLADGRHGTRCAGAAPVTYYHILLDTHEILIANGAPAESLWLGPGAIEAITPAQKKEIEMIFSSDDLDQIHPLPCNMVLNAHEGRLAAMALA